MYKGEADWTLIGEVKNNPRMHIPIFGNGDIDTPFKAKTLLDTYGVDGLMIGRASIGNPWIFREIKHYLNTGLLLSLPTIEERVEICQQHLLLSIEWKGERLGILEMRRHYSNYFRGLPGIKPYRNKLVTCDSLEVIFQTLSEICDQYAFEEDARVAI